LQKTISCANPKRVVSIFREAARIVACEDWIAFMVEDRELDSIETSDSSFGGDPEIAVTGLQDLVNAVLRKAVLARPCLMTKCKGAARLRRLAVRLCIPRCAWRHYRK
jgi:hypothetical protein